MLLCTEFQAQQIQKLLSEMNEKIIQIKAIESGLEPPKIYKVTEEELLILKKGSDLTIYLKVAIALLSIALSLSVTSFLINPEDVGLVGLAVLYGAIFSAWAGGGFCFYMSQRKKSDYALLLKKIEARIKADKLNGMIA